jgi:hypothetical protein
MPDKVKMKQVITNMLNGERWAHCICGQNCKFWMNFCPNCGKPLDWGIEKREIRKKEKENGR